MRGEKLPVGAGRLEADDDRGRFFMPPLIDQHLSDSGDGAAPVTDDRIVTIHRNGYIDCIGEGGVRIVSVPSSLIEAVDDKPSLVHIRMLAIHSGRICPLAPDHFDLGGSMLEVEQRVRSLH